MGNDGVSRQPEAPADERGGGPGSLDKRRGRWADDVPPCDRLAGDSDAYADEDAAWEDEEDEYGDGGEWSWDHAPTPETLKSRWMQECRAVRALERVERHGGETSAALAAARNARDRAEVAWRNAKTPKPVSVRMGFAQRKLDKAQNSVDKCHEAMALFEEEAERRRAKLQDDIDQAEGRLAARRRQMDELLREAGDLAANGEGGGSAERDAAESSRRLCDDIAKDLQAFIETLEEGTEARGRANLLLTKLADAAAPKDLQRFDIASEDGASGGEMAVDGHDSRGRETRTGAGVAKPRSETTWSESAPGRWNRHAHDSAGGRRDQGGSQPNAVGSAGACSGAVAAASASNTDEAKPTGAPAAAAGATAHAAEGARAGKPKVAARGARRRGGAAARQITPGPRRLAAAVS